MQSYIAGLPPPKQDNYDFQDGYDAIFNETEDFWNQIVEIDSNYVVPEDAGDMLIIVKDTGFTTAAVIELPLISTNIGRRISVINENTSYTVVINIKSGSSDNIEGQIWFDMQRASFKDRVCFVATSFGWKRTNRTFCLVTEIRRPAGYVLTAGTATVWTDVSFNPWVLDGCYALLLRYIAIHRGNGAADYAIFQLRPKGSTIDDRSKNTIARSQYTNLATNVLTETSGQIIVECDSRGDIQYKQYVDANSGNGQLFLSIYGYWR